jgi:MFS family permease
MQGMAWLDFLDKEHTVAGAGFNRWLVPPAALAIHLCIGMAYGFSVFWLPLSKAVGIGEALACPADLDLWQRIVASGCDWPISMLGWMYTMFFVFLGLSAWLFGGWLEHAGPRKAGVVSALCWCGGLVIAALGVARHQIWLMWLGSGVIGGIGLGLGYISPVSTLIKWFPDRRGMATGMAIMGFGGGAMIGAPLADKLMQLFASADGVGVWQTFLVMAALYFVFMMGGALVYRVPPTGWTPAGWTPPPRTARAMITTRHVHASKVWGIPQFWLVWLVLCLNVTAGIGILGMASPLLQEIFGGQLLGVQASFNELSAAQKGQIAATAAGFTGLLSLFNIGGRFVWASCSDYLGRKATYGIFFVLGLALYGAVPSLAHGGQLALFVGVFCIILSMYGGGFATVPAYLADLFGTQMVGAIHGRLLTAWAAAGVFGPILVNYVREYQIAHGVPKAQAYDVTMYVLAGLLLVGLLCNLLVRPVAAHHFMTEAELATEQRLAHERDAAAATGTALASTGVTSPLAVALAWLAVGLPLALGIAITVEKAAVLFR